MDFSLTEDQEMFRTHVKKVLEDFEQTKVTRDVIKNKTEGYHALNQTLAEMGVTGITIPEQYNGLDLEALDLVPTYEELGRALAPGLLMETVSLVVPLIKKYGTEEQKQTYLSAIATGEKVFSVAALEPNSDFSEAGIQAILTKEMNGYVLNGVKTAIPHGEEASGLLVIARTNDIDGLSLVIIDDLSTVTMKKLHAIDPAKQLVEVTFDNLPIASEQVLGEVDQGWKQLQEGLLHFNAALSTYIVGAMESVVQMATEYANIREQFGQPIGRFQAIKHRIVDMKIDLDIARSLSYYANWVLETDEKDKIAAVYSARTYATEKFINTSEHNIQVHGGIGFTEEIDCHLYVKRARYYQHYLGSPAFYENEIENALGWSIKGGEQDGSDKRNVERVF